MLAVPAEKVLIEWRADERWLAHRPLTIDRPFNSGLGGRTKSPSTSAVAPTEAAAIASRLLTPTLPASSIALPWPGVRCCRRPLKHADDVSQRLSNGASSLQRRRD